MRRARCAGPLGVVIFQSALVFGSACAVRTYDTPRYQQQQQPRRTYLPPALAGIFGGSRYGQPAQPQATAGAFGGNRYGQPTPPPQYAQPTPQPQHLPGAMGGARYGQPAQPQYPPGATVYGPAAARPYAPAPSYAPVAQPGYAPAVYAGPAAPPATTVAASHPRLLPAPAPHPMAAQPMAAQPAAVWVPANRPEPVWLDYVLAPGQWYIVDAWGAFSVWPDRTEGVDPYYGYGPWYVGAQPQPWGQLLIDDRPMYEIGRAAGHYVLYRADHMYSTMIVGSGTRPRLQIAAARNGAWGNSRGGLWVRIYPAQRRL